MCHCQAIESVLCWTPAPFGVVVCVWLEETHFWPDEVLAPPLSFFLVIPGRSMKLHILLHLITVLADLSVSLSVSQPRTVPLCINGQTRANKKNTILGWLFELRSSAFDLKFGESYLLGSFPLVLTPDLLLGHWDLDLPKLNAEYLPTKHGIYTFVKKIEVCLN